MVDAILQEHSHIESIRLKKGIKIHQPLDHEFGLPNKTGFEYGECTVKLTR